MSNFKPSIYQSAVYDFLINGKGNAVIDAVAGSGKSTTIVNALKLIPNNKTVLFLAFNKSIVEELKIKIGQQQNIDIRTLHSLGASVINKTFRTAVNANKYKTYINDCIKYGSIKPSFQLEVSELSDYKQNIIQLVDLSRAYLCTTVEQIDAIAEKYLMNIIDNECEIALSIVNWGKQNTASIDFTDMIYLPNIMHMNMPQFDYVFIDECQDLNTAQRELFLKTLKSDGRFIAVGDPRQAIYGFAGADVESFNLLKSLPNTISLPLSVCYRCNASIIELAKAIVPQIEARENAPLGTVNHEGKLENILDADMVLCRVTAPLVALCIQFISNGRKAYVKGRDIGANLINMINKTNRRQISDVLNVLNNESDKLIAKIVRKSHCTKEEAKLDNLYTSFQDKLQAIEILSEGLTYSDEVCNRISNIFNDNSSGICLSTVHKAKGLEANNVHIICEDKFMIKRAMRTDWGKEQETNLVYVAYTRAKVNLSFVQDFEFESKRR